ncbi:thiosulfate dehydrogenase [quinone] large subunit [Actinacidiphila yanglinensis]|uniref:Thiosulfate dehydrogenase [quinone] large subunit n=1 Tax=Actinacidiphila yanglinensis TaxID=310779 RepID=A0A1H6BQ89_9ACTN|nr:DoxX family protein [Actinacidiphila yanglinensis]SEG62869.1 thiosulfate dehydrogenase [quinone] large subunit [Actinacidiphila yanglinensis]
MLETWRDTARRYALLPLRIFLGVTFTYAGIDKLTSNTFFTDSANGSLLQTLHGVRDSAAIPAMVDLALKAPHGFGYAIALGELAVGLGVFFGLLGRVAALGGALISLSLWLTVSWSTTPYYYGNDLAYLMAWLPMVLAGTPYLSLDVLVKKWRAGADVGAGAPASGGGPGAATVEESAASGRPVRSAPPA